MKTENRSAKLILEDGTIMHGKAFGKRGTATGEICFNTSMTGYQEIFTDPSYSGQVLVMNNVHIGNYGVLDAEVESDKIHVKGVIARNLEDKFSRSISKDSLQLYFENNNLIAIEDIDTRFLVKHIRNKGAMNVIISSDNTSDDDLRKRLAETPSMKGLELASQVSTLEPYVLGDPKSKIKISVLDLGLKRNILNSLIERGAYLKIFPAKSKSEEILSFKPHGVMITNGPGDPSSMSYAVDTIKSLVEKKIPVFGICLGHQLLCLSKGIKTFKMPYGHRGANHPILNLETGLCEISTQNHGFGVLEEEAKKEKNIKITHLNLNDSSIEGIKFLDAPAFSVQYHPESTPGTHDSKYLFDIFFELIQNSNYLN